MAFSSGFSPHPKISYANAAPTGTASEAEYVEIAVVQPVDPQRLRDELDTALPRGLDVVEVVEARTGDFAERLQASRWRIEVPRIRPEALAQAARSLWEATSVEVTRRTKSGERPIDVRAALLDIALVEDGPPDQLEDSTPSTRSAGRTAGEPGCAILRVVVRQVTPTVRPDDILAALRSVAGLSPEVPAMVTREAQGPLGADGVTIGDPLVMDREDRADQAVPAGAQSDHTT